MFPLYLCASKRSFNAAVDFTRGATVAHLSNEVLFSNTPDDCAESRLRRKCAIPDNRRGTVPLLFATGSSPPDLKTRDAWMQGVKCSHPEADAADSEESYLKIKKRFESVRWRSGGILYPPCASRQVAAQEASGGSLIPPVGRGGIFSHPG